MKSSKIIVHCLVKNEENFIWYALSSVLPYVDRIMVWDNGSTDKTVEMIKTIKSPKIKLEKHPVTSREEIAHLRQQMLVKTPKIYDWLMILDGDEIWSKYAFEKVIGFISLHPSVEMLITQTYNLVGDIYHRLPEKFGKYNFRGKEGNFALRFINLSLPGLHVAQSYGTEGYFDDDGRPIQNRPDVTFVDTEYFHATHLVRSSKNKEVIDRPGKIKYYLGTKNPTEKIPEVFFGEKPATVPDVTGHMGLFVILRSVIETQLRNIKAIFNENR